MVGFSSCAFEGFEKAVYEAEPLNSGFMFIYMVLKSRAARVGRMRETLEILEETMSRDRAYVRYYRR